MEAEMNDEAFGAEGLVKRFKKATALDGVDLAAPPGTVLGVLGPNGAGKSTAIRILATLTDPDEGSARRSEEHTSELQSRGHLVCRLLLEKKKQRSLTSCLIYT